LAAITLALALPALAACSGDKPQEASQDDGTIKSGVASVVSGAVSATKDVVTGISQGVDEGRQSGASLDGAVVILNQEDFQKLASVSVLRIEERASGEYMVTIGVKNDGDRPLRVSNLMSSGNLVLLDEDGFAYRPSQSSLLGGEITVLPKSGERARLLFEEVELKPKALRIYQVDHSLPELKELGAPAAEEAESDLELAPAGDGA
jgi:hypothetical protein